MDGDPLRALMRGCKRKRTSSKQRPTEASSHSTELAPDHHADVPHEGLHPEFLKLVTDPHLRSGLQKLSITQPTAVQRRVIPRVLENDVVAIAPTGSGKTLAYLLPLLSTLVSASTHQRPRALIIAPTRELTEQIARVTARLIDVAKLNTRHKSLVSRAATAALKAASGKTDLVISTPLRLQHALDNGAVDVSGVRHVVLDEADELLTENFISQIDGLLAACDRPRIHMFSATLPPRIDELAAGLLKKMHKVVVDGGAYGGSAAVNRLEDCIEQKFVFVGGRGEQGKVLAVRSLLRDGVQAPVLVFVQSKDRAAELFRELIYDGVRVDSIHADRSAAARSSAIARFRAGDVWVLIATDVLGRGLDFLGVNTVINYDMPSSGTAYVHRIGRTGRNGRHGSAITLFTEEDDKVVGSVVRVAKASGADVPDWLLRVAKRVRKDEARRLERRPPIRKRVGGPNRRTMRGRAKATKKNEATKTNEIEEENIGAAA